MTIEWLLADVTAVGSLVRAERAILGVIVAGRVFGPSGSCLWSGSHFVVWEPQLSPNKFTWEDLVKIKWFVDNVTAVRSPGRAELAILGVIVAGRVFGQFRPYLPSESHLVMKEPRL